MGNANVDKTSVRREVLKIPLLPGSPGVSLARTRWRETTRRPKGR